MFKRRRKDLEFERIGSTYSSSGSLKKSSKSLGKGGLAHVFQGKITTTTGKIPVALKLPREDIEAGVENFEAELDFFKREYYHENIIKCLGFINQPEQKLIILESCYPGGLWNFFRAHGPVTSGIMAFYLCCPIFEAVRFIHSKGFVHRDITPFNILLNLEGRPVLSDFGTVLNVGEGEEKQMIAARKYVAPEYYAQQQATEKSDAWSMGMTVMVFDGLERYNIKDFHQRMMEAIEKDLDVKRLEYDIYKTLKVPRIFLTAYYLKDKGSLQDYKFFKDRYLFMRDSFLKVKPRDRKDFKEVCGHEYVKECLSFWKSGDCKEENRDTFIFLRGVLDSYLKQCKKSKNKSVEYGFFASKYIEQFPRDKQLHVNLSRA